MPADREHNKKVTNALLALIRGSIIMAILWNVLDERTFWVSHLVMAAYTLFAGGYEVDD